MYCVYNTRSRVSNAIMLIFTGRSGTTFWRQNTGESTVRIAERRGTSVEEGKGTAGPNGRAKSQIGSPRKGKYC